MLNKHIPYVRILRTKIFIYQLLCQRLVIDLNLYNIFIQYNQHNVRSFFLKLANTFTDEKLNRRLRIKQFTTTR